MSKHSNTVKLIEYLLYLDEKKLGKTFDNSHEQMLFERGYLTGLLASILDDDFYAMQRVQAKIKELKEYYKIQ